MALSKDAQNLLVEATRLIGIPGVWIQGKLTGDKEQTTYCALGAICKAAELKGPITVNTYLEPTIHEVVRAVSKTIQDIDLASHVAAAQIALFNDKSTTTQADVREIFCKTVKREVTDDTDQDTTATPD